MKKISFILGIAALIFSQSLNAQDPKHKNYYKNVAPIEQESYQVTFDDMVAKMDYSKFAFKLKNLSNDFILLRKAESSFLIDGKEYREKVKELIIKPNKTKSGTFNVSGETNYHVNNYSFQLGGVYLLPANGKVHEAPNFDLPASKNTLKFGDFELKLKKLKKETKETIATFEVTYRGNDYAILDPSKLGVILPDVGDDEFANDAKGGTKILRKGKKTIIKAVFHIPARYKDMQFANMEILWRDTFQSSTPTILEGGKVDFVLDPGLTAGKNR